MKKSKYNEILEQSLEVLCKNPHASMYDIADKINVSRATLYRYFENKDVLLVDAYLWAHARFMNMLSPILEEDITAKDKFLKFMGLYISSAPEDEYFRHNSIHLNYPAAKEAYYAKNDAIKQLVIQLKNENYIDNTISEDWFVLLMKYMTQTSWEVVKEGNAGKNTVVQNIENLLFRK